MDECVVDDGAGMDRAGHMTIVDGGTCECDFNCVLGVGDSDWRCWVSIVEWGGIRLGLGVCLDWVGISPSFLRTKRHRRRALCISRELSCILPTLSNYSMATNDCVGRWESAAPFATRFFNAARSLLLRGAGFFCLVPQRLLCWPVA